MLHEMPCPCGTGQSYARCCGALHRGERAAATALELMRSRYAAYHRGELDYLVVTLHPGQRDAHPMTALAAGNAGTEWTSLRILDTVRGGPADSTGVVEFEAHHEGPAGPGVLRERSRFIKERGAWYYLDAGPAQRPGPAAAAPGRNDPCGCGSGKKFKKCCGRA